MTYIDREIFPEVLKHLLNEPEMTIITGSRQVGKTVLLEQLKESLQTNHDVRQDAMLSFNLDIVQDWEKFQDQTAFISYLRQHSRDDKIFIFIDEAQKAKDAASFFKGVYDSKLNAKLVLTGSSSLELKAHLKESLAGRKQLFHLPSFTFLEFLRGHDHRLSEIIEQTTSLHEFDIQRVQLLYDDFLTFGGYPRVALEPSLERKIALLREIYSSYIERDAVGLFEVTHKTAFIHLLRLLASQAGQLINIAKLADSLNIDRFTVERYILILEESFIIQTVKPYFNNPRQEVVKAKKIYFLDNGILNTALDEFRPITQRSDKGHILENGIASELSFRTKQHFAHLHFWRTKQQTEVDFIIERGNHLAAAEVKYSVRPQDSFPGLTNFTRKFKPQHVYLLSPTIHPEKSWDKVQVLYPFYLKQILQSLKPGA